MIDDRFKQLSHEKQERILNAAIKEFAQYGFKNASTNEIVREAGIAKGSLFQYFTNKTNLYLYLYEYLTQQILREIEQKNVLQERDIFIRHRLISEIKLEMFKRYPVIFDFFHRVLTEDDPEVKSKIESYYSRFIKIYHDLMANIDITPFKDNIDPNKAINIIMWAMEGFAYHQRSKISQSEKPYNFDHALDELDEYIEILKWAFYKV